MLVAFGFCHNDLNWFQHETPKEKRANRASVRSAMPHTDLQQSAEEPLTHLVICEWISVPEGVDLRP